MLDLFKKGVYLGLGVLSVTKEKAEAMVDELVAKGEVSKGEAKKVVDSVVEEAEAQQEKISSIIEKQVGKVIGSMGLATKEDIKRLEEKIDKLSK